MKIMEDKRLQSAQGFSSKQALDFLGDIKSEFKKISWTTREELQVYTNVVVIGTLAFGMSVYFMDMLFQNCIFGLNEVFRFIMG